MAEEARAIYAEDESGKQTDQIGWITPAAAEDVAQVVNAPVDGDGRGDWVWLRFADGTLMLGLFPQGDTYMQMSDKGVCDFEWAEKEKTNG